MHFHLMTEELYVCVYQWCTPCRCRCTMPL